jgi:hypothetical protein
MIATRVLRFRNAAGDIDMPVRIFAPELESDGTWFCRYEIDWPEGTWRSRAGGVDAVQALFSAFQMIGSDLYTSDYHKAGQLYLEAPGRGYGFPVPVTLRDLLIGDDRKYL